MALGLLLGASTVGFDTGLGDLALQGALTGVVVGPVQALALAGRAGWAARAGSRGLRGRWPLLRSGPRPGR